MSTDLEMRLREALIGVMDAFGGDRIEGLVVGGLALSYHLSGSVVIDHDVDVFIAERDVERAIAALVRRGFDVDRTYPTWLFKARLDGAGTGATVDVLHLLGKVLLLDREMLDRATQVRVDGIDVPMIAREDLAIAQAGASSDAVPGHWFQAVDLLRSGDVDWDYFVRRAGAAPQRCLALAHYAASDGIAVPPGVFDSIPTR